MQREWYVVISEMARWSALIDPMMTFYREQYERVCREYEVLRRVYRECKHELYNLRNQYERLEEYATEQEERAAALHSVIDHFISRNGRNVRRDLLDSFNEVANELGIELEELDQEESDFSLEDLEDMDE